MLSSLCLLPPFRLQPPDVPSSLLSQLPLQPDDRPYRFRLRHSLAGSSRHPAESSSSRTDWLLISCAPPPPLGDAVTFDYGPGELWPGRDFHPPDSVRSWTHECGTPSAALPRRKSRLPHSKTRTGAGNRITAVVRPRAASARPSKTTPWVPTRLEAAKRPDHRPARVAGRPALAGTDSDSPAAIPRDPFGLPG